HIDLFDPKPDAPETVRGPFKPLGTDVPGMRFTSLLPRMAKHARKLAVVRSLHHTHTQHNSGMHWSIVGKPYRIDNTLINPSPAGAPSPRDSPLPCRAPATSTPTARVPWISCALRPCGGRSTSRASRPRLGTATAGTSGANRTCWPGGWSSLAPGS